MIGSKNFPKFLINYKYVYMDYYKVIYTGVNILVLVGLMMANFNSMWVLLLVNVSLFLGQITDLEHLLKSFSNDGILTVLLIFPSILPLVKSMEVSHYIHRLMSYGSKHYMVVMLKITVPVFILSAFVPNTPIVVALYSFIDKWCTLHDLYSSKYLIPLSYATILGGTNTLIGTSTNLLGKGIVRQWGYNWNIVSPTRQAILPSLVALVVLILLAYRLLPSNHSSDFQPKETVYRCRVVIHESSSLIGSRCFNLLMSHVHAFELYRNGVRIDDLTNGGFYDLTFSMGDAYYIYSPPDEIINFLV